ncbi:hypothetical protein TUM16664_49430 [Enterobacter cloacae]|nr:hypothetical protein TUM16664_49430 [Enterobacter cloacae]
MINAIRVLEDKDFVWAIGTSPDSLYEAIETYRNYIDTVEEIEFEHVLLYLLCSILVEGATDVTINDEARMCIEHLVNEKNIIRKNNTGKKV